MVFHYIYHILVGGLEHVLFFHILGIRIATEFHIFRGVGIPPTSEDIPVIGKTSSTPPSSAERRSCCKSMRLRPRNTPSRNRRTAPGTAAEVSLKKQRNTSKNAETIWKSLEIHGNILKQLLKTSGHMKIYMEQHGKKQEKRCQLHPKMDRCG